MNKITFIKPKSPLGKIKLTLHKTGKFGFTNEAKKILNLTENRFIKFGLDNFKTIFLKVQLEQDDECFRIAKAGEYYYIFSLDLLEQLNVKKGENITFDLIEDKEGFFKMNKRYFTK
jgi:hypothetical protein